MESLKKIRDLIYFEEIVTLPEKLEGLPQYELLALYLYSIFCQDILTDKVFLKDKRKLHSNLLRLVLLSHPEAKEFFKKNPNESSSSSDEEEEEAKNEIIVPLEEQPMQDKPKTKVKHIPGMPRPKELEKDYSNNSGKSEPKAASTNLGCKFDFPNLDPRTNDSGSLSKKPPSQAKESNFKPPPKIIGTGTWESQQQKRFIYQNLSSNTKSARKEIEEEFPTLGDPQSQLEKEKKAELASNKISAPIEEQEEFSSAVQKEKDPFKQLSKAEKEKRKHKGKNKGKNISLIGGFY